VKVSQPPVSGGPGWPPKPQRGLTPGQWTLPIIALQQMLKLYLIMYLYSRMIVGWEIHDTDDAAHTVHLIKRTALAEGVHAMPEKPVPHGDNGSTPEATSVLAMLNWLGVKSYSSPRVSDDNAFVESLFKTAK
jgi:putative transposase